MNETSFDLGTLLPQGLSGALTISASISSLGNSKVPKANEVWTPMLTEGTFFKRLGRDSSFKGVDTIFTLDILGIFKLLGLTYGCICFNNAVTKDNLSSGESFSIGVDDLNKCYNLCIFNVSSSSWFKDGLKVFKSFK